MEALFEGYRAFAKNTSVFIFTISCLACMACAVDVVVVGAGLAGLTAARRLVNEGGFNVTVLEARPDRYGGRILTDHSLGIPLDIGASWIPGSGEGNPITRLARQAGIALANVDTLYGKRWSPHTGQVYNAEFFLQKSVDFIEMMFATAEMARAWPEDVSVLEALNKTAFSRVLFDPLMLLFASDIIVDRTGADLDRISAQLLDAGESLDGTDQIAVTGLDGALRRLVEGGRQEERLDIKLGQEVRTITLEPYQQQGKDKETVFVQIPHDHSQPESGQGKDMDMKKSMQKKEEDTGESDEGGERDREDWTAGGQRPPRQTLRVETRAGSSFTADAVIMAVSLGTLQSGHLAFDPPLPDYVTEAIYALGFGVSNKLILEFDVSFWGDEQFYGLAPSVLSQVGLLNTWFNMKHITGRNLLLGLISGDHATETEEWSDDQLQSYGLEILAEMFGDEKINKSKVINRVRTRWLADPYARGMFSYYPAGSTYEQREVLTEPIGPHMYIAGEHTSAAYFGTLHGAFFSGQRAAENLIKAWSSPPQTVSTTETPPVDDGRDDVENSEHAIQKANKYISAPDPTDYSYQPHSDLSNLSSQSNKNQLPKTRSTQPHVNSHHNGTNAKEHPGLDTRTTAAPPSVTSSVALQPNSAPSRMYHCIPLLYFLMIIGITCVTCY